MRLARPIMELSSFTRAHITCVSTKHVHVCGSHQGTVPLCCAARSCKHKRIEPESTKVQEALKLAAFSLTTGGLIHTALETFMDHNDRSLEALHSCLDIRRMYLGSDHASVAELLHQLGNLHWSRREYYYANELMVEALSILLVDPGADKDRLKQVWMDLAKIQDALGDKEDAKSSRNEAQKLGQA